MLNDSIRYTDGNLCIDGVRLDALAAGVGTPAYIYSLPRALANYHRITEAFAGMDAHVHYSAKANANLSVLRALVGAGAGVDAVSAGECYRALKAGCAPGNIVFAGVGKTVDELRWALRNGIGWFNVENVREVELLDSLAAETGVTARVSLRLNPDVTANTHPYIATGHGGAKFGLTPEAVAGLLAARNAFRRVQMAGIHVHIGSQLGDTHATVQAVEAALEIAAPYPDIRTIDIGGGMPATYAPGADLPTPADFAAALRPLLTGYQVILEPGRSIIADAGVLLMQVQYVKRQAGQRIIIVDGSMAELMRPALYQAKHMILPLRETDSEVSPAQVVGPVCETADVLGKDVPLPEVAPGDLLAVLTAGAYGMVMASNYNARPRPPEVVIEPDGQTWRIARPRETWDDLLRGEG